MWIVPKTLSHCVQDSEGLNLGLDEQAWILEQSVTWRSKHMCKRYWLRRLKKGGWITQLSTRILKPSLHQSFEEKYVESLGDTPANHFHQQENDKVKKTQDTCGHTSGDTSGQLEMFGGASSRMSSDIPRWGYGESCPIWKKRVSDAYGEYSQRKKLVRPIKEKESLSWPSPRTGGGSRPNGKGGRILSEEVKIAEKIWIRGEKRWGTPQASDHVEGARTRVDSNQKCLGRDLNRLNSHQDQMSNNTNGKSQEQLNPDWVEQLMGLITGMTDLGSWGTESAHKPQN